MNKLTNTFINNAGKSNQKPVVEYSAFTGKVGHELDMTLEQVLKGFIFIVVAGCIAYTVYSCLAYVVGG